MLGIFFSTSDVASRWHLHSAKHQYVVVRRHSISSYCHRAFAVGCPSAWNSLSDDCVIQRLALTISDICLKLGCFRVHTVH